MSHPLALRYWRGVPGVVAAAYIVIGLLATPDMALVERVVGAVGGAFLLVAMYWALYRVWAWVWPSRRRRSKPIDD